MQLKTQANRLLAGLPEQELRELEGHFEQVDLKAGAPIYSRNQRPTHVYFPLKGVASLVSDMEDGVVIEIATIGPEGIVGLPVVFGGETTPHRALMQVAGNAVRIPSDIFVELQSRMPHLGRLLMRYALALLNQIGQNAACNRAHTIEERAARWLLMTHDRVHEDRFYLTQEFLAQMLGVRRPTVSLAAGLLMKAGLIEYSRGQITILNRKGLEAASCECYRVITEEFERLVGGAG